jgi:hypothetical protein
MADQATAETEGKRWYEVLERNKDDALVSTIYPKHYPTNNLFGIKCKRGAGRWRLRNAVTIKTTEK